MSKGRPDRVRSDDLLALWLALILAWLVVGAILIKGTGDDWRIFWNAAHHIGNLTLLTEARYVYTPGSAWVLWPFAQMPLAIGYFVYVFLMIALATGAALLASNVYGISARLAVPMALAWFPFSIAIFLGQNSPVALLLTMVVVFAIVRQRDWLAGLGVALLLYKPNDAIPFLLLFVVLKQWRSLAAAAISIPIWYLLSVAATGDWAWPLPYSQTLTSWFHYDAGIDAVFSINIPGILLNLGSSSAVAVAVGAVLLLLTMPLLSRVSRIEAASVAPLAGIACSPHAYGYEAILALPILWLAVSQPNRARIAGVCLAYCIAPLYYFSRPMHFDSLAIPVLGAFAAWLWTRLSHPFAAVPPSGRSPI